MVLKAGDLRRHCHVCFCLLQKEICPSISKVAGESANVESVYQQRCLRNQCRDHIVTSQTGNVTHG